MRRLLLPLLLALLATAHSQGALDIELGQEFNLSTADNYTYALARYNLPLGAEVFGARAWLLPEAGLFLSEPLGYYGRLQFLVDAPYATLFADVYADPSSQRLRTGVRFGIP